MWQVEIKGRFGDFTLDVAFEAGSGVTALFGPSGAGKSLILRALAGLWQPTSGSIRLHDTVFFDSEKKKYIPPHERKLGAVFQRPLLFPHMDVAQNLGYGMAAQTALWDGVVDLLDIAHLLQRMPANLSGGEAQRVSIGRALLSNPRALLLDEPLTGLDDDRREQVLPYLEKLPQEFDLPIIYVSHNRDEIMRLADFVFPVQSGRIGAAMSSEQFKALNTGGRLNQARAGA